MPEEIEIKVNGEHHQLELDPEMLLVDAIREELGFTGTKVGCETSLCGSCTVHLDGKAVKSCTYLAVQADGREIRTVEDLANDDELHPLQNSFQKEFGLQCGYCTPGILMTTLDFLVENDDPSRDEIRQAIDGNLCRCTGYQNIVDAIETASNNNSFASSEVGSSDD